MTLRLTSALLGATLLTAACGDDEVTKDTGQPETVITDADEDGYDAVEHDGDDCDDANDAIHPGADEHCDGVDEDCDGTVDEDAVDMTVWYLDGDGDSFGDDASMESACSAPSAEHVEIGGDCDDTSAAAHPEATEDCTDPADLDCNGDPEWADADGDGWAECEDCNDDAASVNPDATELCNDFDDDCDGDVDGDATDAPTWYADADADGFGDAASTTVTCDQPTDHVGDAADCDDTRDDIYPGADELCDEDDLDCDGDATAGAIDMDTWYADTDGDGYGDVDTSTEACDQPSGYLDDDQDCDDGDDAINPDADEDCDLVDNDCNGTIDDGCPEECDDGYDNDSDGLTDCFDDDCDLECPEDECDDGLDDDGDGLIDCEDGDCSGEAVCDEDCSDGTDNDVDGLTDCEDDDCWGTEDCPQGLRAAVTSAASAAGSDYYRYSSYLGCRATHSKKSSTVAFSAQSVEGVLQVLPSSSANWGTATTWTSCGWSASMVSGDESSITRSGFHIDSGCGVSTSGFLPSKLRINGGALHVGESGLAPWYQGSIIDSTTFFAYTNRSTLCWGAPGRGYIFSQVSSETFSLSPVSSGTYYYSSSAD